MHMAESVIRASVEKDSTFTPVFTWTGGDTVPIVIRADSAGMFNFVFAPGGGYSSEKFASNTWYDINIVVPIF